MLHFPQNLSRNGITIASTTGNKTPMERHDNDMSKDYVEYFNLDLMNKLWNWYHHNDSFIRSVKTYLWKYIFDGNFNVEFPRSIPYFELKSNSNTEWKEFLSDCFDWINIYGFVPWNYIYSKGKFYPVVPKHGTGQFILYRKKNTETYIIGWMKNNQKYSSSPSWNKTKEDIIRQVEKSGIQVSDTPKTRLKSNVPSFTSDLATAFENFLDSQESRNNTFTTDYNLSHPKTLNYVSEKPKTFSELTESDIRSGDGENFIEFVNRGFYRRKKKEYANLQREAMESDVTSFRMVTGPEGENNWSFIDRKHVDIDLAPMGTSSGSTQPFSVVTKYTELKKLYEESIASLFGIRRSQVAGDATFTTNKIESQTNQTDLVSTLDHYRNLLTGVASDVYNRTFFNYDKKTFKEYVIKNPGLENVKKLLEKVQQAGGIVPGITKEIELKVDFGEKIKDTSVKIPDVTTLYTSGLIGLKETRKILGDVFNIEIEETVPKDLLKLEAPKGPSSSSSTSLRKKVQKKTTSSKKGNSKNGKKNEK